MLSETESILVLLVTAAVVFAVLRLLAYAQRGRFRPRPKRMPEVGPRETPRDRLLRQRPKK